MDPSAVSPFRRLGTRRNPKCVVSVIQKTFHCYLKFSAPGPRRVSLPKVGDTVESRSVLSQLFKKLVTVITKILWASVPLWGFESFSTLFSSLCITVILLLLFHFPLFICLLPLPGRAHHFIQRSLRFPPQYFFCLRII